jgi:hypothetical protein
MIAQWRALAGSVLVLLATAGTVHGQQESPGDQEIARAIARGVDFLKTSQDSNGYWNDPEQQGHRLGVTALAGLALLENGVARDASEITKARAVVSTLAKESDQTYDLVLAILFLARAQQGSRGEADALIQTLGRRLAVGGHAGSWDYGVPREEPESRATPGRARRKDNRKAGRRSQPLSSEGDNSNT